jgi:hypothetical protein
LNRVKTKGWRKSLALSLEGADVSDKNDNVYRRSSRCRGFEAVLAGFFAG